MDVPISRMIEAAKMAGRVLSNWFDRREGIHVMEKAPADFVTAADKQSDNVLRQILRTPGYGYLTEEGESQAGTNGRWIIDPLDGTTNFVHGALDWSVAIALEENEAVQASVIYAPKLDQLYYAEVLQGAFLVTADKTTPLHVSTRHELARAVVAIGLPFRGRDKPHALEQVGLAGRNFAGITCRRCVSLQCAELAAGITDAYLEENYGGPWDVAAGTLLVKEAGGFVEDNGADLFCSTPTLYQTIKSLLSVQI